MTHQDTKDRRDIEEYRQAIAMSDLEMALEDLDMDEYDLDQKYGIDPNTDPRDVLKELRARGLIGPIDEDPQA